MALPNYLRKYTNPIGSVKPGTAAPVSSIPNPVGKAPDAGTPAPGQDPYRRVKRGNRDMLVRYSKLTPAERQSFAPPRSGKGSEAGGFVKGPANQGAAAPVAPGPPAPTGPTGPRVFFDPLSSTLWRTEDGKEFALPADPSNLNFLDGNMLNSSMAKEAAFFMNQSQSQYQLGNALRPFQRQLDKLNEKDTQGRTMYDVLTGQAQDQWQRKADGTMTNAAMRGVYDSGMRLDSADQLATERSNAMTDLDRAYGATAVADVGKQMGDARESWVGQWLQSFIPMYDKKMGIDIAGELEGAALGIGNAAEPAAPATPAGAVATGGAAAHGPKNPPKNVSKGDVIGGRKILEMRKVNGKMVPIVNSPGGKSKTMIHPWWS